MVATVDGREFCFLTAHADGGFRVWHPDSGMFVTRSLPALGKQIRNALVYVVHPLGLLRSGGSINCERLGWRLDKPPIPQVSFVLDGINSDVFQRDYVLLIVFLLLDDDVAVNKNVIEQEELPRFGLLPAQLR